jgi:hypothetical protein
MFKKFFENSLYEPNKDVDANISKIAEINQKILPLVFATMKI